MSRVVREKTTTTTTNNNNINNNNNNNKNKNNNNNENITFLLTKATRTATLARRPRVTIVPYMKMKQYWATGLILNKSKHTKGVFNCPPLPKPFQIQKRFRCIYDDRYQHGLAMY